MEDGTTREAAPAERPVITRYTDYRAYLRAMIAWLKVNKRGFSYRSFAARAGFSSPSFLKLVSDGLRNLSAESVERVATGLGLDRRESEAFEALVELGQAGSDARRNKAYGRLAKLAQRDPVKRLVSNQFEACSTWYTFVLRELATMPGFTDDPRAPGPAPALQGHARRGEEGARQPRAPGPPRARS